MIAIISALKKKNKKYTKEEEKGEDRQGLGTSNHTKFFYIHSNRQRKVERGSSYNKGDRVNGKIPVRQDQEQQQADIKRLCAS